MAEAAAGISLAVIPLALQGYRQIHKLIGEYDSLDYDLRNIRRRVETEEGIFKSILDRILLEFSEEGGRGIMLGDLNRENCERVLHRGLRSEFEHLFIPIVNSIVGVKETVELMKTNLLELDQKPSPSALADRFRKKFNLKRTDSTQPPIDTERIQSKRKRLGIIAKGTVAKLKTLLDELGEHNKNLQAIVRCCRTIRKTVPRETYTYSALPKVLSCALGVKNPVPRARKARPNPIAMQIASKRLYKIVSKALPCNCHTLHLRLEPAENKSKPPSIIEPPTEFSFLLTARCGGDSGREPSDTRNPIIPFIFTDNSGSANTMTEDCGSKGICQELFDSQGEYERYFRDNGRDGRSGFLLRRTSTGKVPVINSDLVSLHDLVLSRSKQLEQYDCFQIAANLLYSILPFYSSPWIRNWTPRSIQFFERHGTAASESTPTSWTPHVSMSVGHLDHQLQFAIENLEIRSLGIMLLELGRRKCLDQSDGDGSERIALEKALIDLTTSMGPGYKDVVERCLGRWSERDMDLMMEENLRDFLCDLSFLEDMAQYYTPETWLKAS